MSLHTLYCRLQLETQRDDIPIALLRVSRDVRCIHWRFHDLAIHEINFTDWERPAPEIKDELKPSQSHAETDEEEENSALLSSSTVSSDTETCQFIDHLKNIAVY
ncbi:hypothetical protein DPMN_178119 [Dreissena polymorpha]|uniref:Uncharacterized protein n=1 Tax=Dreissena polymorpha TaxID=45954 RepID=A0A9D4IMA7_DREPO|nr:hypothetical protein DPMN_178119 [Dreissena polymorpha]